MIYVLHKNKKNIICFHLKLSFLQPLKISENAWACLRNMNKIEVYVEIKETKKGNLSVVSYFILVFLHMSYGLTSLLP